MKDLFKTFALLFVLSLIFTGCSEEDEGIAFDTLYAEIVNEYYVEISNISIKMIGAEEEISIDALPEHRVTSQYKFLLSQDPADAGEENGSNSYGAYTVQFTRNDSIFNFTQFPMGQYSSIRLRNSGNLIVDSNPYSVKIINDSSVPLTDVQIGFNGAYGHYQVAELAVGNQTDFYNFLLQADPGDELPPSFGSLSIDYYQDGQFKGFLEKIHQENTVVKITDDYYIIE